MGKKEPKKHREWVEAVKRAGKELVHPKPIRRGWARRYYWVWAVVLLVALTGGYLWARRHILYTSDAYVEANWVSISCEVSGHVSRIFVEDHEWVEAGQPLFQIDPDQYQYAVDAARGRLAAALKMEEQLIHELKMAEAAIERNQDQLAIAEDVWDRTQGLVEEDWVSREMGVNYYYTVRQNEANVAEAKWNLERIKAALGPTDEPYAEMVVAQAELERAEYDLNRTIVLAPVAGRVTDFYVMPGQYVEGGQVLFALVDTSQWWVTARYKDYTLGNIEVGAKAKIMVDMYFGTLIDGTVEGVGWGVNRHQDSPLAAWSSLPYVEQTEFWIRLAQRFRVRVTIDDPEQLPDLRIGANCRVFIEHSRAHENADETSS